MPDTSWRYLNELSLVEFRLQRGRSKAKSRMIIPRFGRAEFGQFRGLLSQAEYPGPEQIPNAW